MALLTGRAVDVEAADHTIDNVESKIQHGSLGQWRACGAEEAQRFYIGGPDDDDDDDGNEQ